jgi:hypothetical protein
MKTTLALYGTLFLSVVFLVIMVFSYDLIISLYAYGLAIIGVSFFLQVGLTVYQYFSGSPFKKISFGALALGTIIGLITVAIIF